MRRINTLLLLILAYKLFGQISPLSDFLEWPSQWQGDTANFKLVGGQLKLMAETAGSSTIFLKEAQTIPATFRMEINLEFAPSINNLFRIYFSSEPELSTSSTGYFFQLGENGDQDGWTLFSYQGLDQQLILKGPVLLGASTAINEELFVRLDTIISWISSHEKDSSAVWFNAPSSTFTILSGQFYVGIQCVYTESRKDKFNFQNLLVLPDVQDTLNPKIKGVAAIPPYDIVIEFDEGVHPGSALDSSNYFLLPVMSFPKHMHLISPTKVRLSYQNALPINQELTLEVSRVQDFTKHTLVTTLHKFTIFSPDDPVFGDIVIHEIMVDPTPVVGLPPLEYVELYNPTSKTFDLEGFKLAIGPSERLLPPVVLHPGQFLLICAQGSENMLATFGSVYGLSDWATLPNTSGQLQLFDNQGILIYKLNYNSEWYRDAGKSTGGYSLEMVDVMNRCAGAENWRGSQDNRGGTPGQENSWPVQSFSPLSVSLSGIGDNELSISFNRSLHSNGLPKTIFKTNPELSLKEVVPSADSKDWKLTFNENFREGQIYQITIAPPVTDCINTMWLDTLHLSFGKTKQPQPGDLIVTEILFDPKPNREDYVEIYNPTSYFIDLTNLTLSKNLSEQGHQVNTTYMPPKSYLCFSSEGSSIVKDYPFSDASKIFKQSLPTLPNDQGVIYMNNGISGELICYQFYHQSWHHPLIDNAEGVALERISITDTAHGSVNWASASGSTGYGTPGVKNSQEGPKNSKEDSLLIIEKSVFSPDADGYDDLLNMEIHPDKPGYTVQVWLYNERGLMLRTLIPQVTIGLDYNQFSWDGTNMDGEQVPLGRYIIFAKFLHPTGQVQLIKKSVVVAGFTK